MGIDDDFYKAFAKSQIAANNNLPEKGNIFISIKNNDKSQIVEECRTLKNLGFNIVTTSGTHDFLSKKEIPSILVKKILEGRPNILDLILSNKVQMIINTIESKSTYKDSMILRRNAISQKIPYFTTLRAAKAAVYSIDKLMNFEFGVQSIQKIIKFKYH